MQVTEKSHARLGPSGWDWWSNCPGAPALCDGLPNKSSQYAAQGSVAHELADQVLQGEVADPADKLGTIVSYEGYDIEIDQEMVDAVNLYVETVRSLIDEDGHLFPEQQVPIGHLTGEPGATGTSDAIGIVRQGRRLVVVDKKYGKGVRVSAYDNGQGRMYGLGSLEKFASVFEDIEEVEIVIVMSRMEDGTTSEVLSIGEMEEFKDLVELAAARVALADGEFAAGGLTDGWAKDYLVPGEKQCKFCAAKGICPALKAEVSQSMALVSTCSADDFADLTLPKQAASIALRPEVSNEKLAEFLRAVPLMEAAIAGVRGEVERRLFEGQEVPGFYLGEGKRGNRKWSNEAEADVEATLKKKRIKVADIFQKKLVSPAAAEKLLKKTNPKAWEAVLPFITQSEGQPSVCQDGDKNPVYVPVRADDFADLSGVDDVVPLAVSHPEYVMNTEENIALRMQLAKDELEVDRLLS